jgi:hypothetical protein
MSYGNLSSVFQNVLKFYQQLTGEERKIPFIFDDFHFCCSRVIGLDMTENRIFICPSSRRDVLWYTNVRPFHMSRSNLRTPWPIHFKFHRVIGIDGLTVCILYGEISNFHSRVMRLYSSNCRRFFRMSRCKLRTPWPIHFKLRTVIVIDSLTVCILFGEI